MPGLDGVRAIAVVPVLLYHALVPAWPGGFLGVDVFFVISGYLITTLVITEYGDTGRFSVAHFWLRRARRLLPALYLVLAATIAYALFFLPDGRLGLRGNVFAALTYVTNWYQVFSGQSYFEISGRGPLLNHLWSLAVEEQFYLLWPLLLLALLRLRLGNTRTALLTLGLAAISAIWMSMLYPAAAGDPTRVFVRTDARACGLLIGAAMAFVWSPWRMADDVANPRARRSRLTGPGALDLVGLAAVVALAYSYGTVNDFDPFVYRGGFFFVSAIAAVIIAVAVHPRSVWSRLLGIAPLRYLGTRSYGIYLWHWPIFQITRPGLDIDIHGTANLLTRVGLTCAVAELSFRFVERPVRRGAIGRAWHGLRTATPPDRDRLRRRVACGGGAIVMIAVTLIAALFVAPLPTDSADATPTCPPGGAKQALAIGSSSIRQSTPALMRLMPTLEIDASAGRTWRTTVAMLEARQRQDRLADVLILEYASEAAFDASLVERLRSAVRDAAAVVIVPNAATGVRSLRIAVRNDPNSVVSSWYAERKAHPEWRSPTGGLTGAAQAVYAERARAMVTSIAGDRWDEARAARHVQSVLACLSDGLPAAVGIGDSVMVRARIGLAAEMPAMLVAAAGNRQMDEAVDLLTRLKEDRQLPEIVVVHLGTAHAFTDGQFENLMSTLSDTDDVVILNVRAQEPSAAIVNKRLLRLTPAYANVILLDWEAHSAGHERWFTDGAHLTLEGQSEYARFIDAAIVTVAGSDWQRRATW